MSVFGQLFGLCSWYVVAKMCRRLGGRAVVIQVDEATLQVLRRNTMQTATKQASDLDTLLKLNEDYIHSVQDGDVHRFNEILADDFLCSQPDGSLIDREKFLQQSALPVKISNLTAHEVVIRLMGDFAIIHARTTFN